jgi:two-component system sensor histidine kinase PilS (NtrC family)
MVAGILLGVSALWAQSFGPDTVASGSLDRAVFVALIVVSLSALYSVILRFTSLSHRPQAAIQFFLDVLLITWLVWATGDLHSPYSALYVIVIAVSGLFVGARGALLVSVGSALCYTAVMIFLVMGWVGDRSPDVIAASPGKAIEAIGINDVMFLIVGLLASKLAERQTRSDVQLIETEHALASLRALHERIVESIRSGVITTDLDRRIYTMNSAGEEMTGYEAEDLRGEDVSILFGDMTQQIEESLRAAQAGHASARYEAECITAEGFRIRLGYSLCPLSSEQGETTGLVITFQDLTDIRVMEETSRRQERLSAVGRVAAGIAHEIRNPLAAMRGSIQMLRSEMPADSTQQELMEIVLRESDRLNRIIADFLTYARPRKVALTATDLRDPMRETFALMRHSPEVRDGQVLEEVVPPEPVMAMADPEALRQVFWNLTRNALNAMPDGGCLRGEIRWTDAGNAGIVFSDTGRGMTPSQVERLFEPFTSSTSGGTGLGLSIVYQIIRDHGGTINVRSRQGHGTTITVELPRQQN